MRKHTRKNKKEFKGLLGMWVMVMVCFAALFLAFCSAVITAMAPKETNQKSPFVEKVVSGLSLHGAMQSGMVEVYRLTKNGNKEVLLAQSHINRYGAFKLRISIQKDTLVYFLIQDGQYIDGTTQQAVNLKNEDRFISAIAYLRKNEAQNIQLNISSLSTLVAEVAREQIKLGQEPQLAIQKANQGMAQYTTVGHFPLSYNKKFHSNVMSIMDTLYHINTLDLLAPFMVASPGPKKVYNIADANKKIAISFDISNVRGAQVYVNQGSTQDIKAPQKNEKYRYKIKSKIKISQTTYFKVLALTDQGEEISKTYAYIFDLSPPQAPQVSFDEYHQEVAIQRTSDADIYYSFSSVDFSNFSDPKIHQMMGHGQNSIEVRNQKMLTAVAIDRAGNQSEITALNIAQQQKKGQLSLKNRRQ